RDEDAIRTGDRRRHVCDVVSRSSVLPQQVTILRVESNGAFRSEEHHLRRAIYFHGNRRRVTCLIALALPNQRAIRFVERDNRSAWPTGIHQHFVAEYEWRLADA